MPERFRKKPVVIEAVQWTGENLEEVRAFIGGDCEYMSRTGMLYVRTLEGTHITQRGDWIIRGVHGEHYPCREDIFAETYETA